MTLQLILPNSVRESVHAARKARKEMSVILHLILSNGVDGGDMKQSQ